MFFRNSERRREMAKLFLFDGTGLMYRAYFALDRSLSTSKGIPTNAVYGVMKMLIKFLKENVSNDDYVAFVVDVKTTTYRHEILETYKAKRPPTPDTLIEQIPYVKEAVRALGVRVLEYENCEADDVIATLAVKGKDIFDEIYIVTGDKDMLQLVNEKTKVWRTTRGITELELYDKKRIFEKYGLEPSQIVDLLALAGDSSDNVPGVKGIGLKRGTELVKTYGSVENIYKNVSPSTKLGKLLIESKEEAFKSKKVVTLMKNLDLGLQWEDLKYSGYTRDELLNFLKKMEFSSIMKELNIYERHCDDAKYITVKTLEEYDKLIEDMSKSQFFVIDLETDSLCPFDAQIVGFSVSLPDQRTFYVPLNHKEGPNLDERAVMKRLRKVIENQSARIVGQNLKYDYSVMKVKGLNPVEPSFDTMIAAYLLNPDGKKFSLDVLSLKFLGYKMMSYDDLVKDASPLFSSATFRDVSVREATKYSAEDADITRKLYMILNKKLHENNLLYVFENLEMPLIPVLVELELNGVYFDVQYLKELSRSYEEKMNHLAAEIYKHAGKRFNINSPKQVAAILFEEIGIISAKKTPKGDFSTRAEVLEDLVNEHPIVPLILEYRKYQKLKSTYIDVLPRLVHPKTGRIHTSFHQTGTSTGRLSSSNPNMQNLPSKNEEGREIRKAVVPQKSDWCILSADYSQIELRVLAHLSQDETLVEAFKQDEDIHVLTASRIFGTSPERITPDMRSVGKMVNFSVIYGVSAFGLSRRLGITHNEARKFIEEYFQLYPGVKRFLSKVAASAKTTGYVRTLFGRRREIPQLRSKNPTIRREGERMAINTPIQGTAADIMKLAMINCLHRIKDKNLKTKMILQVHDELVFEVPNEEKRVVHDIVKSAMEDVVEFSVPLKVSMNFADNWE